MKKSIGKIGAFVILGLLILVSLSPSVSADTTIEEDDSKVEVVDSGNGYILMEEDGTEYFRLTGGNIGIGVTNPAEKLEIDGNILLNTGADREIYVETPASASNGYDFEIKAGSGYATFEPTTGGDLTLRAGTGGSGVSAGTGGDVYIIGGGHYSFASNIGDVILCADASGTNAGGKVGILTTSPGAILDVRGDAVFNDDSVDYDFRIEGDNDANLFFVDGGNDKIGIGTASPTSKLDVNSDDIRIRTSQTPGSCNADGYTGEIAWGGSGGNYFVYVCVSGDGPGGSTDTWGRAGLTTSGW